MESWRNEIRGGTERRTLESQSQKQTIRTGSHLMILNIVKSTQNVTTFWVTGKTLCHRFSFTSTSSVKLSPHFWNLSLISFSRSLLPSIPTQSVLTHFLTVRSHSSDSVVQSDPAWKSQWCHFLAGEAQVSQWITVHLSCLIYSTVIIKFTTRTIEGFKWHMQEDKYGDQYILDTQ